MATPELIAAITIAPNMFFQIVFIRFNFNSTFKFNNFFSAKKVQKMAG